MANIFLQDPIYITIDELKESTRETGLVASSPDNQKKIIAESQDIIDSYIGDYGEKVDSEQVYIFPVIDELIPTNIKKATILLCENLFNGNFLNGTAYDKSSSNGNIVAEKYGPHSVFFDDKTSGINVSEKNQYVDEQIYRYLEPYITNGTQTIPGQQWLKS